MITNRSCVDMQLHVKQVDKWTVVEQRTAMQSENDVERQVVNVFPIDLYDTGRRSTLYV
jgi:hypothetical protein